MVGFVNYAIAVLLFLFLVMPVEGALIKGTLYDISLDRAHDITIDISSLPKQRYLSKDGTYFFKVPIGNYTLHAAQYKGEVVIAQAIENVTIPENTEYHLDLILFPLLETQEDLLGNAIFDIERISLEEETPWWAWILGGAFFVIIGGGGVYLYTMQKNKKTDVMVTANTVVRELNKLTVGKVLSGSEVLAPEQQIHGSEPQAAHVQPQSVEPQNDLQLIINFLEKEGGRATQKDLRKLFPYSEAKISLMLTELEHKGKIEKIKKGRGNILILASQGSSSQQPVSSVQ